MKPRMFLCVALCVMATAFTGSLAAHACAQSTKAGAVKTWLTVPATKPDLSRGLILHMTFDADETGAGRISDVSGMGNNGRPSGVRWTASGKRGGAYEFAGDSNEIVVANNASVNPKRFTLAAWIKTSASSDKWLRIFDKSYSRGYALSIAADWQGNSWQGLVSLEIGPGTHFSVTRTKVADGQWHHVVATFDGSEQILFVDGKPEGRPLRWMTPGEAGLTDFDLVIGCNRSNVGEYDYGVSFRGLIDEPMMWNRALTIKEVAMLFESQK